MEGRKEKKGSRGGGKDPVGHTRKNSMKEESQEKQQLIKQKKTENDSSFYGNFGFWPMVYYKLPYLKAQIHFLTYFTLYDRLYTYITYHACVWDLGKWYRWTWLQGRNRDAEAEIGYVGTAGEGAWVEWTGSFGLTYTHYSVSKRQLVGSSAGYSVMTWGGDGVGLWGRFKRKRVYIHIADSLSCTVESNTTLKSNYTTKIFFLNHIYSNH